MRVKIIKPHKKYKKDEVVELSKKEGMSLIDSGVAIISKDLTYLDKVITHKRLSRG